MVKDYLHQILSPDLVAFGVPYKEIFSGYKTIFFLREIDVALDRIDSIVSSILILPYTKKFTIINGSGSGSGSRTSNPQSLSSITGS